MDAFLLAFDLRKYSFLETNRDADEVLRILNLMHGLIEAPLRALGAELYRVHTDTALYVAGSDKGGELAGTVRMIKDDVDGLMASLGLPSRLSIACVYGEVRRGKLVLADRTHLNLSGPAMNDLEFLTHRTERHGELNQQVVFSAQARAQLPAASVLEEKALGGHRYYVAG